MPSPLRQRTGQAASLLFAFLLMGLSACSRGPSQSELRKIATSDEVREKRESAERDLRARADEIRASSPWGPPLRTTVVDTCARGGGKNYLDQNAPEQPVLSCMMRLHLYFVVDRPVAQILQDLRSMSAPTRWSGDSIDNALRYYENKTYEKPYTYPPSIGSRTGGEDLRWDAPGDEAGAKVPEPCPDHKAVLATCVSDPADLTLAVIRKRPGTLYAWTLTSGYHRLYRS
ncbi:hypothetical protein GCM10017667_40150 [Streptomyces filamentosus]|uniref:Lipoprotein n=2 Tax=Streptomyces filamentosus TaxID=67294 RepID=A0A919BRF0_STRFL|nr:hypothetical protein GCM10017667_40150 [Streptomyces filamentosus]